MRGFGVRVGQQSRREVSRARDEQIELAITEIFEAYFVPALSLPWVGPVCSAAGLRPGQRVLDVACGTGALAREAFRRVTPAGSVVGLDGEQAMVAVARKTAPQIDWRVGDAEALPFPDGHFDAVVSQFGLMFFDDRIKGLQEMRRVLHPRGTLAVAVWDRLENTPGYADLVDLLERQIGNWAAAELRSPFALGDPDEVLALFSHAGMDGATVQTIDGVARFPSIEAWIHMDLRGWNLRGAIADDAYETLLTQAESELSGYVNADGTVEFAAPAHIVTVAGA